MLFNSINNTNEVLLKELSKQIANILAEQGIIQVQKQSDNQNVEWMSVEDLCEYLPDHPCQNTIYKWKRKGIIPFHKRSKHLYFLRSEIDAWLKSKRGLTNDEISSKIDKIIPGKPFGRASK